MSSNLFVFLHRGAGSSPATPGAAEGPGGGGQEASAGSSERRRLFWNNFLSSPASERLQGGDVHGGLSGQQPPAARQPRPEEPADPQGRDPGLRQAQEAEDQEEQQESQRAHRAAEEGPEGLPDQTRTPEVGVDRSRPAAPGRRRFTACGFLRRYELFLPLHDLWRRYVLDLCAGLKPTW